MQYISYFVHLLSTNKTNYIFRLDTNFKQQKRGYVELFQKGVIHLIKMDSGTKNEGNTIKYKKLLADVYKILEHLKYGQIFK